jgi:hypothetical protein
MSQLEQAQIPRSIPPRQPEHQSIASGLIFAPIVARPLQSRSIRPSEPASRAARRTWVRRILFVSLPLVLAAGAYFYATGGKVMSTDDAYVEADKVGISTDVSSIVEEVDVTHAALTTRISAVNRAFESPVIAQVWDPFHSSGRAALDAMVTQQSQIIDDYKLLMIATLALVPLLLLFKASGDTGHATAVEA